MDSPGTKHKIIAYYKTVYQWHLSVCLQVGKHGGPDGHGVPYHVHIAMVAMVNLIDLVDTVDELDMIDMVDMVDMVDLMDMVYMLGRVNKL